MAWRPKSRNLRASLPPGVALEPFYDQSQLVRDSIASVRDAILIGLCLACVILYLFLRDWRSSPSPAWLFRSRLRSPSSCCG